MTRVIASSSPLRIGRPAESACSLARWSLLMFAWMAVGLGGCASPNATPSFADADSQGVDLHSTDGLADGWAEVAGDALLDLRLDVLPDGGVDVPSDGQLADGVDAGPDSLSDADIDCLPACDGLECGENGCGGSCGQCGSGATCEEGLCVGIPCEGGPACDDLDPCTFDDTCTDGVCSGTAYTCDDGKDCTKDQCDGLGDCAFTVKPGFCLIDTVCFANGVLRPGNECEECITAMSKTGWSKDDTNLCSDGNACTLGDHCADGACVSGTESLTCDDPGVCKLAVCQAASGCVVSNAPGNCEDGNPCTVGDSCEAGACKSGSQQKDCGDNNPCTFDECDPQADCTHEAIPGVCNDGDGCTENDFCENGICKGGTVKEACNDGNICTTDSCINGAQCLNQWNSLPCNDGNECTKDDVCSKGQCGGTVRDCNDNNICTNDFCSPLQPGGCYYVDNDLACNDQDPCTLGDTCVGGKCLAGLGQPNCNDNNECTEDFCVAGSGCSHKNLVAFCSDGLPCTSGDFCANGTCVGGNNICECQLNSECATFEDGNKCNGTLFCDTSSANPADWQCKVDPLTVKVCSPALDTACIKNMCSPATGLCSYVHVNEGLACEDGSACTLGDTCASGQCKAGLGSLNCDDDNVCTKDVCVPASGCAHTNMNLSCNDGNVCTVGDLCTNGACLGGTNVCQCQIDGDCDSFEDGNKCNGTLYCDTSAPNPANWACKVDPPTVVTCSAQLDTTCRKNVCEPSTGVCAYTNVNEGLACDDADPCTVGDACMGGQCKSGLGTLGCNDDNPCTQDSCVSGLGCSYVNLVALCDDGNVCTDGDYCLYGTCVGDTSICQCQLNSECATFEDGDKCNGTLYCDTASADPSEWACQVDPLTVVSCSPAADTPCRQNTCIPSTGLCSPASINEGSGCDDGNGCTVNDACSAGSCSGAPCSLVGLSCVNGACDELLCQPNSTRCDGNAVKLCDSTGTSESTIATCASNQFCTVSGGSASCAALLCVPNQTVCEGSKIMLCNPLGTALIEVQDCSAAGQGCYEAACADLFLCAGLPCPLLPGYTVLCNSQQRCEYTNADPTGWKAFDAWIYVPSATFAMGSPTAEAGRLADEGPIHSVKISKGYFIMKYEAVVLSYAACMAANPAKCTAPSSADWNGNGWGTNTTANGRSLHPQNGLTWQQSKDFCAWVAPGGRLPTEAEWEYAASGATHRKYPWGDTPEPTCANDSTVFNELGGVTTYGCGTGGTWGVGVKSDLAWSGARDMGGNVWEWCEDWYLDTYYTTSPSSDPTGPTTGTARVGRGGSFHGEATYTRSARRRHDTPTMRYASVGARCVRPEPSPLSYVVWPYCEPGTIKCGGTMRQVCNPEGTAFVDLDDCASSGLICEFGECTPCIPNCTGKECGDDGCDGSCGSCHLGFKCGSAGICTSTIGMVWKSIPGGTYTMGCRSEFGTCDSNALPKHSVTLQGFDMLDSEVTQEQYTAIMGLNPSCQTNCIGGNCPADCVLWANAREYCQAIGGRLPTEAEWEYAAWGGSYTKLECNNQTFYCLSHIANYGYGVWTYAKESVKTRQPNGYGLYDMMGNVWEWCEDWYGADYYAVSPAESPPGPDTGIYRVIRGAAFNSPLASVNQTKRSWGDLEVKSYTIGFRCVR